MSSEHIALHDFPGGLALAKNKNKQTAQAIHKLDIPKRVWLPMLQHRGLPAITCVESGQQIQAGELIGRADGPLSANIHASISGEVGRIEAIPIAHRSGLSCTSVEIIADTAQSHITPFKLNHDYHLEDPNALRRQVAEAGIVGLGGAAFPTGLKLSAEADQHLHTLVINGAECAPYISCDEMLMRENAAEIIIGIQILLHILQINSCKLALEEDRIEAIDKIKSALQEAQDERIQLCLVHAKYPEGGERQLIQVISGQEVPSGGLPVDIGYLCHNVGTAYAVQQTFFEGRALTSRVVTVCGDGIRQPRNVIAPLGTSVATLVEACGGYVEGQHRVIVGGPMMGFTIESDNIPIDKGCNCILVIPEKDTRQLEHVMPCIRCGACSDVCPATLLPQQLHFMAQANNFLAMETFHLFDCIECGCCDYVCPSNIPLTQYFRFAKDKLWLHRSEQRVAEVAKVRYEDRNQRLVRLQQERDQARAERHQSAIDKSAKQKQIKAAVARAKAQKQQRDQSDQS